MTPPSKHPASAFSTEQPIQTQSLVTQVVARLREQILSGRLAPEAMLPSEAQMVNSFGVSRTVIREALRHLRAQGLVEVTRGRRPHVKPVETQAAIEMIHSIIQRSDCTLAHLVEVRRALESEVASLAAVRATPAQVQAMCDANEAMLTAATVEQRIQNDWHFHERFAEASNNPIFVLLLKTVAGLFQESLRKTSHSGAQVAYDAHSRLISAIKLQDPQLSRAITLENLHMTELDLEL